MVSKKNLGTVLLIIYDILGANLAYGLSLLFRFDTIDKIPAQYMSGWIDFACAFSIILVVILIVFKLYKSVWRYVSFVEITRVFAASIIAGIVQVAGTILFTIRMPLTFYVIGWLLMFILLSGVRLSYRFFRVMSVYLPKDPHALKRVLVVGGGEIGRSVMKSIDQQNPRTSKVIAFADDKEDYIGRYVDGIPVMGTIDEVPSLVEKLEINMVIIAIPWAGIKRQKEIISEVKNAHCEIKILPGLADIDYIDINLSQLRNVEIEDILGREAVEIDNSKVGRQIEGKTVLVTGGGGSIGSELVRQIAAFNPGLLIIFDIYENSAYELQVEMKRKFPYLDLKVIIGSVTDVEMVRKIFREYKPEIVYHAAAHKHVPLMEDVPCEAIKNNVTGTHNCAQAAADYGTKHFVLISTDKAVNPTNIMGASKRLCEMIINCLNERYDTEYVAVRFGNVVGSNASVVPLFKRQIANGGPVTVTHPEITRFFMTIPEAVGLILQCGAFAKGGEIFVLDMGEPVKIDELARTLIQLSGFTPDVDIKVEYTGLRPGEKLYEEILMNEEGLEKTENDLIFIGKQSNNENCFDGILELERAAEENVDDMIERVAKVVKTYHPKRDNKF